MSDNSSLNWYHSYLKLRFFTRIRRFLRHKTNNNKQYILYGGGDQPDREKVVEPTIDEGKKQNIKVEAAVGEIIINDDWMVVLQRAVKRLHFGSWEEREVAARDIKGLAAAGAATGVNQLDVIKRRKLMAELGVIPPLVAMVGSSVVARRRLAVQALLELANGTSTNKALTVEAGILSKLPENIAVSEESTKHEFAQLVMSLSSLANSQFPIDSSMILPFALSILESDSSMDTKELCLGALYNLSTVFDNAGSLATNEVVNTLLRLSSVHETSEKALATLGNLVVTLTGKKALESNPLVPQCLIEIMAREEKPKLKELSAYVLMILAHQSSMQRVKMAKSGIVHVLLELALLGSPLAQKRALKLLQWFKDERQTRMGPHSGPQTRRTLSIGSPVNHTTASEGKKMMKKMVKQSLYKNMETITRRASAGAGDQDSDSNLMFLVISSSSKSLPY